MLYKDINNMILAKYTAHLFLLIITLFSLNQLKLCIETIEGIKTKLNYLEIPVRSSNASTVGSLPLIFL